MNARPERRRSRQVLPELRDWMESGIPGLRIANGIHPLRIEDAVTEDEYVLSVELPGIDPERDVEISVEGDVLTLRAERTERVEETDGPSRTVNRSEFRYGSLTRSVPLPVGARGEDATAGYERGILTVRVPLDQVKQVTHRIPVRGEAA